MQVSMRAGHGFGWRVRGEREGDERRMCRASIALPNLLGVWLGVWRRNHGWRVRQASSRSSAHLTPIAAPQAQAVSSLPARLGGEAPQPRAASATGELAVLSAPDSWCGSASAGGEFVANALVVDG